MSNLRHHSLVAWQRADDLFIKLHVLTIKQFPAFERFELGSQLRKQPIPSRQTSLKDLHAGIGASVCIFSISPKGRSRKSAIASMWRGGSATSLRRP